MKDELFAALYSMKNWKSLGIDGLACEFYKATWDIVGDDFYCMVVEAFSTGCLTKTLNQGLINLMPKNVARDTLGGWHPITPLTVSYKIMAKEIVLRVREVARKIVRREQIGFVPGHFIVDIVISSCEAMDWATKTSQQAIFLKIDFDKAYDQIDWSFIIDMLTYLGFVL